MLKLLLGTSEVQAFDFSSIDLTPVLSNFYAAVPVVIGVAISIMAFRKAWSFVMGAIRRA